MKKFPVISEKGNVYQVEIFVGESIRLAGFNIVISKLKKGIFGIKFFKELEHYNLLMSEQEMLEECGSYVDIAKYYVKEYERRVKEDNEFEELRNKYKKDFEVWDGRC